MMAILCSNGDAGDAIDMSFSQTVTNLTERVNRSFAGASDLSRQAAYFADAYLTRHLLDALPGVVLVLNGHRQIVFANQSFCQLSGHEASYSLVGQLVGDVLSCHVAHEAEAGCGTGDSCETCGALTAMLHGLDGQEDVQECVVTRQDGAMMQNLTLRVWSAPLRYGDEDFVVLAGMDISHERRRLALERTFFHDILNLVGSIRGFAELMEIDRNIDPLEVSRRIQLASQRVIDEIDAQRVLLAVEKGELKVDQHLLDSRTVLNDVLELYEGQDVARGRTMALAADAVACSFVSDATLLRRILGNMLKNALEASPPGGGVTLGVEIEGNTLNFWVHNNAVIPVEYQQRIFQRDFSTKGSGRGLGTYSMKLLGRFLAGEVRFVSRDDCGTRFTLSLPL